MVPGASGLSIGPDGQSNGPDNPQNLNRYAYALNNPVKYTDPTGHCIGILAGLDTLACIVVIGGGAILVAGTLIAVSSSPRSGIRWSDYDWTDWSIPGFTAETNANEDASSTADRHRYVGNNKHGDGYPDGQIRDAHPDNKGDPVGQMDLDRETAEQVLNDKNTIQVGKQRYGYYNGKPYVFKGDDNTGWHGYPLEGETNPKQGIPPSVLKQWKDDKTITESQYNRYRKGDYDK